MPPTDSDPTKELENTRPFGHQVRHPSYRLAEPFGDRLPALTVQLPAEPFSNYLTWQLLAGSAGDLMLEFGMVSIVDFTTCVDDLASYLDDLTNYVNK